MNIKKKTIILGIILLLGIGFAAVATNLNINGSVSINGNTSNFQVIYDTTYYKDKAKSNVNGLEYIETNPSYPNNTSMTFSPSNGLLAAGDYYEVSYNLLNNSTMYGALVNIECGSGSNATGSISPFSYTGDIENIIITAQGNYEGKIKFTYSTESSTDTTLSFTCKVVAEALSTDATGTIVEVKEMDPVLLDYTGEEQTFTAPYTGTYKLETWGAQGGSYNSTCFGGYGSYSVGEIYLNSGDILYLNIGGSGSGNGSHNRQEGGYNGGGTAICDSDKNTRQSSGGGATHIATASGLLSTLSSNTNSILIVAGGGGGSAANAAITCTKGGSGGGYLGVDGEEYYESASIKGTGYGATQYDGGLYSNGSSIVTGYFNNGSFGLGASAYTVGAGGGYYGGGSAVTSSGGGSGYIGNTNLTNKVMYCYNCTESSEESTKTISTTCVSETPTENCAKIGNGYAKITLVE